MSLRSEVVLVTWKEMRQGCLCLLGLAIMHPPVLHPSDNDPKFWGQMGAWDSVCLLWPLADQVLFGPEVTPTGKWMPVKVKTDIYCNFLPRYESPHLLTPGHASWFLLLLFIVHNYMCGCMYVREGMHAESKDNFQESVFSFHHMGAGDRTQTVRLHGTCF